MSSLTMLLLVIVGTIALGWLVQGIRLYRSSKGDIYSELYGGFFTYFYRYVVLRNCSESSYLRSKIGQHRIVYSTLTRSDGVKIKICLILYNKGIYCACYDRAAGSFSGMSGQKIWVVSRADKQGVMHKYKHPNPTADVKSYASRLQKLFPNATITLRLAFSDKAELSALRTEITTVHFGEFLADMQSAAGSFISDEEILNMYSQLVKG